MITIPIWLFVVMVVCSVPGAGALLVFFVWLGSRVAKWEKEIEGGS